MFNNISNKIKIFAKVVFWVGIVLFGLVGISYMVSGITHEIAEDIVLALVYFIMGFGSWVSACLIYGFGQLIENTNSLNGVQVAQDEDEEEEQEKKSDAIMKDIAAWYLSNIDEDDERKKVIEEYIKKH